MTRWFVRLPHERPPLSMNHRADWHATLRIKQQLRDDVIILARYHKIPPLPHAWVWLEWTPREARRRDTDNPEPTRKTVIDALVQAHVITDDTSRYVTRPENVIRPPSGQPGVLAVIVTDTPPEAHS